MIGSFGDKATSDIYNGESSRHARKLPDQIHQRAMEKLDMVNAAESLDDLKSPLGNRLEPLKGDLEGFHSIRVNDQWRIVFRWESGVAYDVKIVDYH